MSLFWAKCVIRKYNQAPIHESFVAAEVPTEEIFVAAEVPTIIQVSVYLVKKKNNRRNGFQLGMVKVTMKRTSCETTEAFP